VRAIAAINHHQMPHPHWKSSHHAVTSSNVSCKLGGTSRGVAVYHPVQLREEDGRVGDIAFVDSDGNIFGFGTRLLIMNLYHNALRPSNYRVFVYGTGRNSIFRKQMQLRKITLHISE
jgi:hypothetical protein